MSNAEQKQVRRRVSARTPTLPDYRTLVETELGRMKMPAAATIVVDIDGDHHLAHIELDVELIDRRYEVVRLEARSPGGSGLHLEALRALPVASLLRAGLGHLVVMEHVDGETYTSSRPMDSPDPLWKVSMTYSLAHVLGEPPTSAVAEEFIISHNAAAQRVKRARDAGMLPPTTRGRAS